MRKIDKDAFRNARISEVRFEGTDSAGLEIDSGVFQECSQLNKVSIKVQGKLTMGAQAFVVSGAGSGSVTFSLMKASETITFGEACFSGAKYKEVTINYAPSQTHANNGMVDFGKNSFMGVTTLETVQINAEKVTFGASAFLGNGELKNLKLTGIEDITASKGANPFNGCSSLDIPPLPRTIGSELGMFNYECEFAEGGDLLGCRCLPGYGNDYEALQEAGVEYATMFECSKGPYGQASRDPKPY